MSTKNDAWSADEIQQAFQLYRFGYNNRSIAHKIGRSANAVQAMFQREFGLLGLKRPKKYTAEALLAAPALLAETDDYVIRAEANAAFLIALLRAGHKPGEGEFVMTSEARCVPRHINTSIYSLTGSQAAMCVGA